MYKKEKKIKCLTMLKHKSGLCYMYTKGKKNVWFFCLVYVYNMANSDKYVHGEKNDFPLQRIWKLSVSVKAERIEFYPFQNAPNYNFTKYFSGTPYTYLIDLDQEPNYIPHY